MKKVLIVASVASMIGQFNITNIEILQEQGYEVHVACNLHDESVWTKERTQLLLDKLSELGAIYWQIPFSRVPTDVSAHFFAYRTLNALLKKNSYSFVHCHTPIAAAIARLSCWSLRIPVIYTAHGFQFFKGGQKKDWLLYFPVEWLLSWVTTILITINREDYSLSKKALHANRTEYIPGVGLDIKKFSECYVDRIEKRTMLGLPENSIVLLSVGELSSRKNQAVVIKALKEIKDKNIYYLLAGKGELYSYYDNLRKSLGIERQVILLGLRKDVAELYKISDIFIHPSIREGLGMAPLEAMASGLPLICSYINGIKDYVVDGKTGYCIKNPSDIREIKEAIIKMAADTTYRAACGRYNQECIKKFDIAKSMDCMRKIYLSIR